MRFTVKVFFCTIIVIALAMGVSGYFLISSTFNATINRETRQALDESGILCFTIETFALNAPLKYEGLRDKTIAELASTLETGQFIRINDEQKHELYSGPYFIEVADSILNEVGEGTKAYTIIEDESRYFVYTASAFSASDRLLYLETLKDITAVFSERDTSLAVYRWVTVITLVFGAFVMYLFSLWLTRPISSLTRATRDMASGDYRRRAKKMSSDELGLLTDNFNKMADSLQDKMNRLRGEAAARERFVGAFSHELKTPLTAIIGYADLLRSRKLNDEELFLSADYIYKEGKRLEDLSLRLLEIMVLKKEGLILRKTAVSSVFARIAETFNARETLKIEYDEAIIRTEAALLTTTLINIVDNALKVSDKNSPVEITGQLTGEGYRFSVKDYGCGIAGEDIGRLTQAFYMVDKSRSRSFGGAGLGLTLCAEILELFGSELEIESELGKGARVSFVLPAEEGGVDNEQNG